MEVPAQSGGTSGESAGLEYKWIVAIVLVFGGFMSFLDQTIVNIAIPRLQSAFGADLNTVQWVITAYTLTQGVVTPITAFFADRLGTKRFYIIALTIFTIGSALCGFSWNLSSLIVFRILQGVGGAFVLPLSITLLYREFPPEQRGIATGIFGIAALLAPAVGPTLGGYFVTYADWPYIFFVNVPVGVLAVLLSMLLLHEVRSEVKRPLDVPGFILAGGGLAALLYALSDASTDGWGSSKVLSFLITGIVMLCLLVVVELVIAQRGGEPLVDLRLFANRPFLWSNVSTGLVTFAFFGGMFIFPVYLQDLRLQSAFQAGLLLLPQAFASIITAVIGGQLVDRIGVRSVVIPGLVVVAFITWLFTRLTLFMPFWQLQMLFVLRGLALGVIIQPLVVSALSELPPEQFAQASSLNTVVRFVSTSLGVAVLATLIQTQAKVHYSHLAERITPETPFGQLIARLPLLFIERGADLVHAKLAAVQVAIKLVQQQSYMLALQDTFWLTLAVFIAAFFSTFFVQSRRSVTDDAHSNTEEAKAARLEAMLG